MTPDADTDVTLILEHVTEATPVVLGSRALAASDGRSLTVDVDLAVLDENGRAIPTLTAAEFTMIDSDCAFGAVRVRCRLRALADGRIPCPRG